MVVIEDQYSVTLVYIESVGLVSAGIIWYVDVVHVYLIHVISPHILLISMGKSIKKLSHASLHLFHKIGLIHVAIILMVVGIKIKGSPAILSILPISSLLLLLILLIGILIEVVVLVVKGPLWISILMVALMRMVPVVPRLLVLLYVRDSVIHSIDILAHKISISIVLDTVMVAVDSHRHLRSLVFKFVIIPVDLDAGPTILDHYSIAISTDRYHQGATLNKYLILIARNVDISTTIL